MKHFQTQTVKIKWKGDYLTMTQHHRLRHRASERRGSHSQLMRRFHSDLIRARDYGLRGASAGVGVTLGIVLGIVLGVLGVLGGEVEGLVSVGRLMAVVFDA